MRGKNALFEVNSSFLDVSEQSSKHFRVSKAQQTRVWPLSIVIVDEFHCLNNGPKHMCFDILDFQGRTLFQLGTFSLWGWQLTCKLKVFNSFMGILKIIKNDMCFSFLESRIWKNL